MPTSTLCHEKPGLRIRSVLLVSSVCEGLCWRLDLERCQTTGRCSTVRVELTARVLLLGWTREASSKHRSREPGRLRRGDVEPRFFARDVHKADEAENPLLVGRIAEVPGNRAAGYVLITRIYIGRVDRERTHPARLHRSTGRSCAPLSQPSPATRTGNRQRALAEAQGYADATLHSPKRPGKSCSPAPSPDPPTSTMFSCFHGEVLLAAVASEEELGKRLGSIVLKQGCPSMLQSLQPRRDPANMPEECESSSLGEKLATRPATRYCTNWVKPIRGKREGDHNTGAGPGD